MQFTIAIAGLTVALDLPPGALADRVRARYAGFLSEAPAALVIETRVVDGARFIPVRPGPWVIETEMQAGRVSFCSYSERGWADFNTGAGLLEIAPGADPENFLRVLFAWLALANDGLLLHACGVIRGNRAYVFFGPSGAGKTTTARLSLNYTVLSDDLVLLRRTAGCLRAYGVPFRGQFPQAPRTRAAAPLTGLYALAQDREHRLANLPPALGVARLVACAPFTMRTPASRLQVLNRCAEIARQLPVQALHFRKDAAFWEVLPHAQF